MRKLTILMVGMNLFGLVFSNAFAESIQLSARIVDPRGAVQSLTLEGGLYWKGAEAPLPVIRLEFPKAFKVSSTQQAALQILSTDPGRIEISLREKTKTAEFQLEGASSLIVDLSKLPFKTWRDSFCQKSRVALEEDRDPGPGLHAGLRCRMKEDGALDISVEVDKGSRVSSEPILAQTTSYEEFQSVPLKQTKLTQGGQERLLKITLLPARPKWLGAVSAGPTFFNFSESPATVTVTNVGLGVGGLVRWSPGRLGAEISARASLLQLVHTSSSTARPIIIEAFAHAHYYSLFRFLGGSVDALAGAHFTHMIVAGNAYGLTTSFGPEIGLEWQQDRQVLLPPKWRVQVRAGLMQLSPLHLTGALQVSRRINGLAANLPLWLRADGRFFSAGNSTVSNTALGISASLGLLAEF